MEHLTTHQDGNVLAIALGQGETSLSIADMRRLAGLLTEADGQEGIGAIALIGTDGRFCTGGNLQEFVQCPDYDELADVVRDLFRALAMSDKPIVAGVDGSASGLGLTMLLHCDMVFATERSRFSAPFVDLGLVPEAASTLIAPTRFGYHRAFELFCLGSTLDAEAASAMGVVNELVVPEALTSQTLGTAQRLARKPASALQMTRQLMRGNRHALVEQIDREVIAFRARLDDPANRRRLQRLARLSAPSDTPRPPSTQPEMLSA